MAVGLAGGAVVLAGGAVVLAGGAAVLAGGAVVPAGGAVAFAGDAVVPALGDAGPCSRTSARQYWGATGPTVDRHSSKLPSWYWFPRKRSMPDLAMASSTITKALS